MAQRSRNALLIAIVFLIVSALLAPLVQSSGALELAAGLPSRAAGSSFDPTLIEGDWRGRWHDAGQGTGGLLKGRVRKLSDERMYVALEVTGEPAGCGPKVAKVAFVLPRVEGRVPNPRATREPGWSRAGFAVFKSAPAFGSVRLIYEYATRSFSAKGSGPACALRTPFSIRGHLARGRFGANLTFEGESTLGSVAMTAVKRSR